MGSTLNRMTSKALAGGATVSYTYGNLSFNRQRALAGNDGMVVIVHEGSHVADQRSGINGSAIPRRRSSRMIPNGVPTALKACPIWPWT